MFARAVTAVGAKARDPVPGRWRECEQCGLVSALPDMRPELVAECPRCRHTLWRMRIAPFQFPIACGLAGALFYAFATVAPFLEISAYGRFQLARIETGPFQLEKQDFVEVGLLVLFVTVVFPAIKLGIMLTTLIGLQARLLPPKLLKALFRWYAPISPWAMVDVYLLGFLVAYTRLVAMASVHLDTALYALIGLVTSMAAVDASLDVEAVWRALDHADRPAADIDPSLKRPGPHAIGCLACGFVNEAASGKGCARCGATLRRRKTNSISRAWALVIASALLYIPANIYPVMWITKLAKSQSFTIMGGIVELANYGLWPLAILVFFASISIPLLKLVAMGYMLVTTQTRNVNHLVGRTRLFRLIDFIGRWSMIDVFMISILVALVRFGQFADVRADVGAVCFACVVVLTMFAVRSFDPRLMWDAYAARATVATAPPTS